MDALSSVVNWIVSLGASVFLPIVMFIIGIIFGMKPGKAFKAGVMLGIAFTAISALNSALLSGTIAPVAQTAMENSGTGLEFIDVGWTPASMIAWAWPLAATVFPLQIIINLIMLALNWTDTLNVDLWNVWTKIFLAAIAYTATGNLLVAYVVASVFVVAELKLGDLFAKDVQDSTGIPDVTCTHSGLANVLPVMPIAYIVDNLPFLKGKTYDAAAIQKKIGFLGDPSVIGIVMGIIIGLVAGKDVAGCLKIAIAVASYVIVLPRIAQLFSEALMPISNAATTFMKARFPGRKFNIGLDWPILTANPAVVTSSVLLIPVTILLAIVLPGNKTLPFGDVANLCAFIIGAAVLFRGDIVKTFITGIPIIIVGLYSSTTIGPLFTQLAASVGYEMPAGASAITYFKAGPFIWDVVMAVEGNWFVFVPLTILFAVGFWMIYKFYFKPRNAKAAEAEK